MSKFPTVFWNFLVTFLIPEVLLCFFLICPSHLSYPKLFFWFHLLVFNFLLNSDSFLSVGTVSFSNCCCTHVLFVPRKAIVGYSPHSLRGRTHWELDLQRSCCFPKVHWPLCLPKSEKLVGYVCQEFGGMVTQRWRLLRQGSGIPQMHKQCGTSFL